MTLKAVATRALAPQCCPSHFYPLPCVLSNKSQIEPLIYVISTCVLSRGSYTLILLPPIKIEVFLPSWTLESLSPPVGPTLTQLGYILPGEPPKGSHYHPNTDYVRTCQFHCTGSS